MKIFVITNDKGAVLGTCRAEVDTDGKAAQVVPLPRQGQHVHEVDLPDEHLLVKDPQELHVLAGRLIRLAKPSV